MDDGDIVVVGNREAAQVRAMYEIAVREGTFVPRGLVFFDLAVRGYRDNRPGLNGLRAALAGKETMAEVIAREYVERFIHQSQLRRALGAH